MALMECDYQDTGLQRGWRGCSVGFGGGWVMSATTGRLRREWQHTNSIWVFGVYAGGARAAGFGGVDYGGRGRGAAEGVG